MKALPLVEKALGEHEIARSSDKHLIMAVWYLQDKNYHEHFKQFFLEKAISPETIRRIRQKLQEQGKYLPTDKVDQARFNKYKQVKQSTYSVEELEGAL